MKVLLDTQAFLGWIGAGRPLPGRAAEIISGQANECLVSHVTAWETGIKISIGKLQLVRELEEFYLRHVAVNRFTQLPITLDHIGAAVKFEPRRGDPFDRLLAAQAILERVPIVSGDAVFDRLGVRRIW